MTDSLPPPSLPTIPLPSFRQPSPRLDPPPEGSPQESPSRPLGSPESPEPTPDLPESPDEHRPPILEPEARTRTSWVGRGHGAGDPVQAGRVIKGALAILFRFAQAVNYRRGRWLRLPTREQLDGMANPLGRIAVRYIPMDLVGPTLADATEAVAAAHDYTLDGPLTGRLNEAPGPDEDQL